MIRSLRSSGDGFTLIELLVSITMFLIFIAGLYAFYRGQVFAYRSEEAKIYMKESADVALDFIVKELRMAGSRPRPDNYPPTGCTVPAVNPSGVTPACGPGFAHITEATATAVTFRYDFGGATCSGALCGDGCPDDPDEQIRYRYDAASRTVFRELSGDTGLTRRLVEDVTGFDLRYFRRDGTEISRPVNTDAARAAIRRVDVTLSLRRGSLAGIGGDIEARRQSATIFLRNPSC